MCGRQHPTRWGECARGREPPLRPCPPHGAAISRGSPLSVMIAAVLTRSGWDSAMECEPPIVADRRRRLPRRRAPVPEYAFVPWLPARLRCAPGRIVMPVGAQSSTAIAGQAAVAVAAQLGTEPVIFPGGHDGFRGGEYGGVGEPDAFAATLRKVLTD